MRKRIAVLVGVSAGLVFLGGILINFASEELIVIFRNILGDRFLGIVISLSFLIAVVSGISAWRSLLLEDKPISTQQFQRIRETLIIIVKKVWIEGRFRGSLYNQALIELDISENESLVERPWDMFLQTSSLDKNPVIFRGSICDLFNEANKELLILGNPGSGKTTLLLNLAQDLVHKAETQTEHQIPVIFLLESWRPGKTFENWLTSELVNRYQIPRPFARYLIENDLIILLLDGLDDLKSERKNCVDEINKYRSRHRGPIVVCSRLYEYTSLKTKLKLSSAIIIEGLSNEQINSFLSSGGTKLRKLKQAIKKDDKLRDLSKSPLFLTLLALTFSASNKIVALNQEKKGLRKLIFKEFVVNRLSLRKSKRFTSTKTINWMRWIASTMKKFDISEFRIEDLQPKYIPNKFIAILYTLVSRFCVGLIFSVLYYLISELFYFWSLAGCRSEK